MKKPFLELPVVSYQYSEETYRLAKRAGVKPDEIAERDGIEPSPVVQMAQWRFDIVLSILIITQDAKNPDRSIVDFEGGGFDIVELNHRKLAKLIGKFFQENEIQFTVSKPPNAIRDQYQPEEDTEEDD